MPQSWFALETQSKHEGVIGDALGRFNIESFWPTYTEQVRRSNRTQVSVVRPLFPGYMFGRFDVMQSAAVLSIAGVFRIVSIGLVPAPIPDEQIESVRNLLRMPLNVMPCQYDRLHKGDIVEIRYSADAVAQGTVVAQGKDLVSVVVSIEMLGRACEAVVPRERIKLVQKAAPKVITMPSKSAPVSLPKAA